MTDQPATTVLHLTSTQAAKRLQEEGPNTLPTQRPRSVFVLILNTLREPMLLLLVGCATLYWFLGDAREAFVLGLSVLVLLAMTVRQSLKTDRALFALREMSAPRARVVRDGKDFRIPGSEVVRGDLLLLVEGERVAADGTLIESHRLQVDESMLTGESAAALKQKTERVYAGTLVVSGFGAVRVTGTGVHSELGKMGRVLNEVKSPESPLEVETHRLVGWISGIAALVCIALTALQAYKTQNFFQGLIAGLTAAMSLIPEEFAVILTVFLAFGARRFALDRVLVRTPNAMETLGKVTALCVDKTGTLTTNRMRLQSLWTDEGGEWARPQDPHLLAPSFFPEDFHRLLEFAVLASQPDPFDPMDRAVRELGRALLEETEHWHPSWKLAEIFPISPETLSITQVWKGPSEPTIGRIAAKGAPETILDLCHLSAEQGQKILAQVGRFAEQGYRVLGVAYATGLHSEERIDPTQLRQHDFDFQWQGLLAFEDPLRPEVRESIAAAQKAGIQVAMLTGDHPATALAIARQAGLLAPAESSYMTGIEVSEHKRERGRIAAARVFARVLPDTKLHLVRFLQAQGHIVAMTGDGVNDALAIQAAHVGIAMGERGTDVAREASDLVLLDDDFRSIILGVARGRSLSANLKRAFEYTIAVHVPLAGMALFPAVFGLPLFLSPILVLFLELLIDPACSIVFESEPPVAAQMQGPPSEDSRTIMTWPAARRAIAKGSLLFFFTAFIYVILVRWLNVSNLHARGAAFLSLIVGNWTLLFWHRDPAQRWTWTRPLIIITTAICAVVLLTISYLAAGLNLL